MATNIINDDSYWLGKVCTDNYLFSQKVSSWWGICDE